VIPSPSEFLLARALRALGDRASRFAAARPVAVAWAIRLLALAALVAFVTWLLLFSGVLLLVAIAFAVAAYLLLRAEVAANPVYLLPPAAGPEEDAEIIEDIVPTGTAVGIPLGFTRRAVRVRREDGERPRP